MTNMALGYKLAIERLKKMVDAAKWKAEHGKGWGQKAVSEFNAQAETLD